jgi:iron complex transport system substrate-binding protein
MARPFVCRRTLDSRDSADRRWEHLLGTVGERSRPIEFNDLAEADPELIVIGCCGWSAERTTSELEKHLVRDDWQSLRAFKSGRIHIVDAESRFTSPGISIADATEELANLFHSTAIFSQRPLNLSIRRK